MKTNQPIFSQQAAALCQGVEVFLETLEPRIAPASLAGIDYKSITVGSPQLLTAGQGLSTSEGASGSLILKVEAGSAKIFTTDLNGNGRFDPNEITGIAAGDGLKITSFVDINGDVVTNLKANGQLTDSDGDSSNGNDGLIVLNSKIASIALRSVTQSDIGATESVANRIILSNYSLHGAIYAGGGIGSTSSPGIAVDTSGLSAQVEKFTAGNIDRQTNSVTPNIGGVKAGTAVSGQHFSFGYYTTADAEKVGANDVAIGKQTVGGELKTFVPGIGQVGGSIIGIQVGTGSAATGNFVSKPYTIGFVVAGDGGLGAKGGDIINVGLNGDSGGLKIVAGNGGDGPSGGAGGNIVNLSDEGSINSVVQIRTGDGGEGFLGSAGASGTISFGTFKTNGNVYVGLGNGGSGLINGGAGTSLIKGDLAPDGSGGDAVPVKVIGSYRPDGSISTDASFDFDQDGYNDAIYLTNSPNQLAVKFGTSSGVTASSPTLFFNSPIFTTPDKASSGVVVGDFNGDGWLDIAAASSGANSTDGIRTFINPVYTDATGNHSRWETLKTLGESGGNYVESYLHTALPFLPMAPDPLLLDPSSVTNQYAVKRGGGVITDLVTGDFDGDLSSSTDLAYLAQNAVNSTNDARAASLVILKNSGDGYFYADFRYDRTTDTRLGNPVQTILAPPANGTTEVHIKSTVTTEGDLATTRIVLNAVGEKNIRVVSYDGLESDQENISAGQYRPAYYDPGDDPSKPARQANPVDLVSKNFTILDIDKDGFYDMVVLGNSDAITTFNGSTGTLTFQDGVKLVGEKTFYGDTQFELLDILGRSPGTSASGDAEVVFLVKNTNGSTVYQMNAATMDGFDVYKWSYPNPPAPDPDTNPMTRVPGSVAVLNPINDKFPQNDVFGSAYVIGGYEPNPDYNYFESTSGGQFFTNVNALVLRAGDGGDGRLGSGGSGGLIGTGGLTSIVSTDATTTTTTTTLGGAIKLTVPAGKYVQPGEVKFNSGTGGSGYINGGNGGGIAGLFVRFAEGTEVYYTDTSLYSGDGGIGLTGRGGNGGSLSGFSVEAGYQYISGSGGWGTIGGNGGAISPNSTLGEYSVSTSALEVVTGRGGSGITAGGAGGSISSFEGKFLKLTSGVGGWLLYSTGAGGDAVAGTAGAGGNVTNSSPLSSFNNLAGFVNIATGDGGNGLTGGNGGLVSNFSNLSTITTTLTYVSIVSGSGGSGVTGNGGNGGAISSVTASGTGIESGLGQFNRVISGDGGDSFGATGGAGGNLTSLSVTSNSSAQVVVAGTGGDGLKRGGNGGAISNVEVDSAAGAAAKVMVFSGAGGNAFAALATAPGAANSPAENSTVTSLRAFGMVNGVGGNGGNISSLKQLKTTLCSVDIIAGNGGSTVNYGTPAQPTNSGVGRGGSISGITLVGEAGRIKDDVAIKSYGDDFVENVLRNSPETQLNDTMGNVGVIVGVAGRVKGDLPAWDGSAKTGSVTNFSAGSIMSMVAGSVDRIAAINTISGIKITGATGVLGAYKTVPIGPGPDHSPTLSRYFSGPDQTGSQVSAPVLGGSLADGAIVVQNNNSGLIGPRLFTV